MRLSLKPTLLVVVAYLMFTATASAHYMERSTLADKEANCWSKYRLALSHAYVPKSPPTRFSRKQRRLAWKYRARLFRRTCVRPEIIIRLVFGDRAYLALPVAECESHLRRKAHNASGASGTFQLMPMHWHRPGPRFNPYNSWSNVLYSYRLSNRGLYWGPWTCKP